MSAKTSKTRRRSGGYATVSASDAETVQTSCLASWHPSHIQTLSSAFHDVFNVNAARVRGETPAGAYSQDPAREADDSSASEGSISFWGGQPNLAPSPMQDAPIWRGECEIHTGTAGAAGIGVLHETQVASGLSILEAEGVDGLGCSFRDIEEYVEGLFQYTSLPDWP
ncbi:hypothetical protein B0H16DRAFT_1466810 [Mycena metata]|uniref:Uncharacterized protein n=1 Tax=Mycena metata TaxID=1033252 RepID=A0AAD7I7Z0_9AGAR|nr:hypothetical protein B0H16DRAFT_1466810 [Mycena metata]